MAPTSAPEHAAAAALLLLSGSSVLPSDPPAPPAPVRHRSAEVRQGMARARAVRRALQDMVAFAGVVGAGGGVVVGGGGGGGGAADGASAFSVCAR
jgi:hypothetical protein